MRRSKHMAKNGKGIKVLKTIIILAITFLAGIIVTFCQKQANPVAKDENATMQTTSSKPKKHKKAASAKKEAGTETKVSGAKKASSATEKTNNESTNESDKIEQAKKVLDKYCKGEHLTGDEAKLVDWYCRTYNISPQPEGDWWKDNNEYDDEEPKEDDNNGNADEEYHADYNTTNSVSDTSQQSSWKNDAVAEKPQVAGCSDYEGGNYGSN